MTLIIAINYKVHWLESRNLFTDLAPLFLGFNFIKVNNQMMAAKLELNNAEFDLIWLEVSSVNKYL